jgi:hypothetical protein
MGSPKYPGVTQNQKAVQMVQAVNAFHRARTHPISPSPGHTINDANFSLVETIFEFFDYLRENANYGVEGQLIGDIRFHST